MENGEIPENANEHCPGPQSESAGKSDACQGCPNQEVCATAPKGPDPGLYSYPTQSLRNAYTSISWHGKF